MLFEGSAWYVRQFIDEDILAFMEYRNNLEWMKYQHFKGLSYAEYASYLLAPFRIKQGGQLAIIDKTTEQLMGDLFVQQNQQTITIGYTIHPDFAHQGWMKEVLSVLLAYLQKKYKKKTIQAFVYPDNIASIRLLEKIGFVYQSHDPKNKRALYQYRHKSSLNIDSKHHFD